MLTGREPALFAGLVVALLQLAAAFGAPITGGQQDAILGLVSAVLTVLGAFWIRARVTPT